MTGIDVYEKQYSVLLILKEGVDALTVAKFRHLCDDLLARGITHFIIDLSQTPIMDSAGIAALVYLFKRCRMVGGAMKISKTISPAARRFLRLTRFDHIFETVDIHHRAFDLGSQRNPLSETSAVAEANQAEPQLRLAQKATVLDWSHSIASQLQSVNITLHTGFQSLLNTTVLAFVQRLNRQFSVG